MSHTSTYSIAVIDCISINVSQLIKLVGQCSNLMHALLMSSQVRLESLVLLLEGRHASKIESAEVINCQILVLSRCPRFVCAGLGLEALCLALGEANTAQLLHNVVLASSIGLLKTRPRGVDVPDLLVLGCDKRRTSAQAQLGLQRGVVHLKLALVCELGWHF